MSRAMAVQQVGNLLTQSGVPSGISLDVAQRLLTAINSPPDSSSNQSRLITSNDAKKSNFYNGFKPPEQRLSPSELGRLAKDGVNGRQGRNGLIGFFPGEDGEDGIDGIDGGLGDTNIFNEYISQYFAGLGFDPRDLWASIAELRRRVSKLEKDLSDLQFAVRSMKYTLDNHSTQLKNIWKILRDTVECPEA